MTDAPQTPNEKVAAGSELSDADVSALERGEGDAVQETPAAETEEADTGGDPASVAPVAPASTTGENETVAAPNETTTSSSSTEPRSLTDPAAPTTLPPTTETAVVEGPFEPVESAPTEPTPAAPNTLSADEHAALEELGKLEEEARGLLARLDELRRKLFGGEGL